MARQSITNPMWALVDHPFDDDWRDFAARAVQKHQARRQGIVYVVVNPVNAHWFKVGVTGKCLNTRLRSLRTAGVVGQFIEVDQIHALDRFGAEGRAHKAMNLLSERHKEFFVTDWKTACRVLRNSVEEDNAVLLAAFPFLSCSAVS